MGFARERRPANTDYDDSQAGFDGGFDVVVDGVQMSFDHNPTPSEIDAKLDAMRSQSRPDQQYDDDDRPADGFLARYLNGELLSRGRSNRHEPVESNPSEYDDYYEPTSRQPEKTRQQKFLEDEARRRGIALPEWFQLTDDPDLSGFNLGARQGRAEKEFRYKFPNYSFFNTRSQEFRQALEGYGFSVTPQDRPTEIRIDRLKASGRSMELGFLLDTPSGQQWVTLSAMSVNVIDFDGGQNPFTLCMVENLNDNLLKMFDGATGSSTATAAPAQQPAGRRSLGSEYSNSVTNNPSEYDDRGYSLPQRRNPPARANPVAGQPAVAPPRQPADGSNLIDRMANVGQAMSLIEYNLGLASQPDPAMEEVIGRLWNNRSAAPAPVEKPQVRQPAPSNQRQRDRSDRNAIAPSRQPARRALPPARSDARAPRPDDVDTIDTRRFRKDTAERPARPEALASDDGANNESTDKKTQYMDFVRKHPKAVFIAGSIAVVAVLLSHNSAGSNADQGAPLASLLPASKKATPSSGVTSKGAKALIAINSKNATKLASKMSKELYEGEMSSHVFTTSGKAYLETSVGGGWLPQGTPDKADSTLEPYVSHYLLSLDNGKWEYAPKITKGAFTVKPSKDSSKEVVTIDPQDISMTISDMNSKSDSSVQKPQTTMPKAQWKALGVYMSKHGNKIFGKYDTKDMASADSQMKQMQPSQVGALGELAVLEEIDQKFGSNLSKEFQPSVAEYLQTIAKKLNISTDDITVKFKKGQPVSAINSFETAQKAQDPEIDKSGTPSIDGKYRLAGVDEIKVSKKK